ncbi:tRNA (N6-threonylcarbamoyladenosine(37)-N6)-methyltransferase TrmO [Parachitinimonas caeni]|uniref:tRNA (N6-threonylcarbamoyladenosine(37)-N6)-methyltransferase TrmO n=1 Tax=Parachitinimonas caeni TaxID=3031301 RepID=A0ABT7DXH4_9NEIS|nr:tRNA (N6-threonylcarbamoyladenosine(37)-N6)-methyltransferase TrmO [Parachitinimonas caeni]MDK2124772.1 tRNA (N6-threonylcarbamoyladenosine(37)-N6)-methyltransferase TrmO [Parachitinimonas caeni]
MSWQFEAIGRVESPYKEKFAIPRQPGLAAHAKGRVVLLPPYDVADAVRGLEGFSHIWLSFIFHATAEQGWRPTVRPPKLGGNARVGVFATRSTFRPNPIGLSVVRLLGVDIRKGVALEIEGMDLLDGTPIIDIKPYLPFVDSQPGASMGFAPEPVAFLQVMFHPQAEPALQAASCRYPDLVGLIRDVLAQDPRPGYADDPERVYGMQLYDLNIRWRCVAGVAEVLAVEQTQARLGGE